MFTKIAKSVACISGMMVLGFAGGIILGVGANVVGAAWASGNKKLDEIWR